MEETLNIKDYLEATSDAAKRTRVVMISIVVASVIAIAGFLNSFEYSWTLQRTRATAGSVNSGYFNKKFPNVDGAVKEEHYKNFLSDLTKSYVDSYTVRVPFFGITFDVNDLGIIGGSSFAILLILLQFSLIRELDNLELSFAVAQESPNDLKAFYDLLAMRQVFLVPPTDARNRKNEIGSKLKKLPKYLHILPTLILLAVLIYDLSTFTYGEAISTTHTIVSYVITGMLLVFLVFSNIACHKVWVEMEDVWSEWNKLYLKSNP
jgi:hypothetical protein